MPNAQFPMPNSQFSMRLVSLRRQQIQKVQGIFKDIAPGVSLAEKLIRERREEARRESEP